jgi:hypothetical protein
MEYQLTENKKTLLEKDFHAKLLRGERKKMWWHNRQTLMILLGVFHRFVLKRKSFPSIIIIIIITHHHHHEKVDIDHRCLKQKGKESKQSQKAIKSSTSLLLPFYSPHHHFLTRYFSLHY